jgi:hypothetical protein
MPYNSPKKKSCFKMKAAAYGNNPMKKNFPDLTGDGKVTQADVLKGRGVFQMKGCPTCGKLKCTCGAQKSDNMADGRSKSAAFQKYSCKKRG